MVIWNVYAPGVAKTGVQKGKQLLAEF